MSRRLTLGLTLLAFAGASPACECNDDSTKKPDAGMTPDAGARDGAMVGDQGARRESSVADAARTEGGGHSDFGPPRDGRPADAAPLSFSCKAFTAPAGWTVATGYRAVVIADTTKGLKQPVALTFAGGAYLNALYVVDQSDQKIYFVDVNTGLTRVFSDGATWTPKPKLLTSIVWDKKGQLDGALYVGDQGGDGDADSVVYRLDAKGAATVFTKAPGPGLDDVFGMVFSPGAPYPTGLFITGDTDGSNDDWGVFDATGKGSVFSQLGGAEGLAVDESGKYGGAGANLFAARPAGGGYPGDDTISSVGPDGKVIKVLLAKTPGIHAPAFAPKGAFNEELFAASWSSHKVLRISAAGTATDLASGLSLTNYDGNILAFTPDGSTLHVADRQNGRVVCIEPTK
ncbi:MAG: hypothetical protein IT371_03995 [Deltaproteobacteria bacterium]|nr:hypothetical protein [Deltaproteobacteria bacterium]